MYLTEQEILDQPVALAKTVGYFQEQKTVMGRFFEAHPQRRFVFFGCGSSYMLAKSAQRLFAACPDTAASAIAGGDYLLNPGFYAETLRGSIVVSLSRSGRTSEIVRALKHVRETLDCPIVSITMAQDNDIMPFSDLDLTMDWCYDKSVCQTRTVTNLYAATLLFAACYRGDQELEEAVETACRAQEGFLEQARPELERIARMDWNEAVVLADGAVCGIAEEGALAFTEISMLPGRYFNLLDYRHGPIVLNGPQTLTIMLIQPEGEALQRAMAEDLKSHGGIVVTVSEQEGNPYGTSSHICIPAIARQEARGIPFLYVMQMIALTKALERGGNPDAPTGLDAFITLK